MEADKAELSVGTGQLSLHLSEQGIFIKRSRSTRQATKKKRPSVLPDNGIRVRYPLTGYCFAGVPRTFSAHHARSLLTCDCRSSYSELKGGVKAGSLSGDRPPSDRRVYDSIRCIVFP